MSPDRARVFIERLIEGGPLLQHIETAWAQASAPTLEELAQFASKNGYRFSGDDIAQIYRQDDSAATRLNDLMRRMGG